MADQDLRALERTWRTTNAEQDLRRWLSCRYRQGDLAPGPVRRAALLGDPWATEVDPSFTPRALEGMAFGDETRLMSCLAGLGPEYWLRCCLAVLPGGSPDWEAARLGCLARAREQPTPRSVLACLEVHAARLTRTDDWRVRLLSLAVMVPQMLQPREVARHGERWVVVGDPEGRFYPTREEAQAYARTDGGPGEGGAWDLTQGLLGDWARVERVGGTVVSNWAHALARARLHLVPVLLGYGDPLQAC